MMDIAQFNEDVFTIEHRSGLQRIFKRRGNFSEKIVLIIGSESAGVSEKLIEKADLRIEIPMPGPTESLNAAVAGSILIHFIKSEMGY